MTILWTLALCSALCVLLIGPVDGQTTDPNAGLQYLQTIPVPNWTQTGTTQANYDIFSFNPQTRIMYIADRTNHAITAIDTRTDATIGVLQTPSAGATNGVLVVPELQQLVVTDAKANVFVYDLRLPGNSPDTYVIPNIPGGTDALDYDPINHTVYVINGTAPYYLVGIDLLYKRIATQFALPGSPEFLRFNPVDGLIYQVIDDNDNKNAGAGVMVYDPVANKQVALYPTPGSIGHDIEIDPVANTAVVVANPGPTLLMNLKDGSILTSFPDAGGADLVGFNPNNRRFYTGSSANKATTTGCPKDSTSSFPTIGVIDSKGPSGAGEGEFIGVSCAGRNAKLGVDPIQNFIYVGIRQYPVDPNSATTGGPAGVEVYKDPAPPAQQLTTQTQATLTPMVSGGPTGTVLLHLQGRSIRLDANLQGVKGKTATVNVTTTVGNEVAECSIDYTSGNAGCNVNILGDPLVGGTAMVGVDGVPSAKGTIAVVPGA